MSGLVGRTFKAKDGSMAIVTSVAGRLIDMEIVERGNGNLEEGATIILTSYVLDRYLAEGLFQEVEETV